MEGWEYAVKDMDRPESSDFMARELNKLGEEGWELVSVTRAGYNADFTAFLKRKTFSRWEAENNAAAFHGRGRV